MRKTSLIKVVLLCLISVLVLSLYSCELDDAPVDRVDPDDVVDVSANVGDGATDTDNNIGGVGDTLLRDGVQWTLDAITRHIDDGEGFISDTPEEGHEFILLWFTISNTTDEEVFINMFHESSYLDNFSISTQSIMWTVDGETIWGGIAAGRGTRGYVAYQVPIGWQIIEFRYRPILATAASTIIFQATPDDITE